MMRGSLRFWAMAAGVFGFMAAIQAAVASVDVVRQGIAHEDLYGIDAKGQRLMAVGTSGELLYSQDSGQSWQKQQLETQLSLLDVSLGDKQDIAVGQLGLIMVGQNMRWNRVESGSAERLLTVAQGPDGLAIVAGGFGAVLRSEDAGQSWVSVSPDWTEMTEEGLQPHLYDVCILPNGDIFMVGEFGLVLYSSDRGQSWQKLHQGDASLFSIDIDSSGRGYAAGQSNAVYRTEDAGRSWARLTEAGTTNWLAVRMDGQQRVLAAGMREMMLSENGGNSWLSVDDDIVKLLWFSGLSRADAVRGVVGVGQAGTVIRVRPSEAHMDNAKPRKRE